MQPYLTIWELMTREWQPSLALVIVCCVLTAAGRGGFLACRGPQWMHRAFVGLALLSVAGPSLVSPGLSQRVLSLTGWSLFAFLASCGLAMVLATGVPLPDHWLPLKRRWLRVLLTVVALLGLVQLDPIWTRLAPSCDPSGCFGTIYLGVWRGSIEDGVGLCMFSGRTVLTVAGWWLVGRWLFEGRAAGLLSRWRSPRWADACLFWHSGPICP